MELLIQGVINPGSPRWGHFIICSGPVGGAPRKRSRTLAVPFVDLPEYISPESTARLFADDCILYRTIETESNARDLQLDLGRLQQ